MVTTMHTYQALEVSPGCKVTDQGNAFALVTAAQEESWPSSQHLLPGLW